VNRVKNFHKRRRVVIKKGIIKGKKTWEIHVNENCLPGGQATHRGRNGKARQLILILEITMLRGVGTANIHSFGLSDKKKNILGRET